MKVEEILELKELIERFPMIEGKSLEKAGREALSFRKELERVFKKIALPEELRKELIVPLKEADQGINRFFAEIESKKEHPQAYTAKADKLFLEGLKGRLNSLRIKLQEIMKTLVSEEINEKGKGLYSLRKEEGEMENKIDSLAEDLRRLVEAFATETTPKGYPCYKTEEIEVILEPQQRYEIDTRKFIDLLVEKGILSFQEDSRAKEVFINCLGVNRSYMSENLKQVTELLKITPKEIEEITMVKGYPPRVRLKPLLR
jgi:predicted RNase H-like nuclease (RuvC/YqgF family)